MDTHFGKENNCKLYMLKSNDGRNQEIWVKWDEWIRPNNIISEGSEMPHAVRELLRKWSDEINKIRNEFQNKANIGYAYIDFVYDSVVYKLEPAADCSNQGYVSSSCRNDTEGSEACRMPLYTV